MIDSLIIFIDFCVELSRTNGGLDQLLEVVVELRRSYAFSKIMQAKNTKRAW